MAVDLLGFPKMDEQIATQEEASAGLKSMEHLIRPLSQQSHQIQHRSNPFDCRELTDFTDSKMPLLFVKHKLGRFWTLDRHHFLLLFGCTEAMSLEESIILLMASALIAGSTCSSIFHFKATAYQYGIKELNIGDIILHPYLLPDAFYNLIFMTLAFATSLMGLAIVLQSMIKKQPVCLRVLPLPSFCAVFTSYCFVLNEKVPKFWVTTSNELFKIPSSWLIWICCLCIVLILTTIWFLGKLILSFFCNSDPPESHCRLCSQAIPRSYCPLDPQQIKG